MMLETDFGGRRIKCVITKKGQEVVMHFTFPDEYAAMQFIDICKLPTIIFKFGGGSAVIEEEER
jgi:hypothetical protein